MRIPFMKTIAGVAMVAAAAVATPALAGGYYGGGGWGGGGYHGGYWGGGGWVGPAVGLGVLGLATGAIIASQNQYPAGYYGAPATIAGSVARFMTVGAITSAGRPSTSASNV